ncbi:hypothetical protein NHQ30_000338 [Ciborinia camelliae]|nr:hypothetical protein NHQ30_000338 [Ciborinia camelliae]
MFTLPLILVAGGLSTLSIGAPLHGNTERDSSVHYVQERATNSYTVYSGDGDIDVGWPTQSEWISSFDTMFDDQKSVLEASCSQFDVDNNSEEEISHLKSAIKEVSATTGVDSRFILAIVMQESKGCVRAPTTVYSISNPGLMQSHEGSGSCNSGGSIQNPCPKSEIVQMITDGTAGTSSGDGLKQCLAETGVTDVSMYYKAARIYNSGSIAGNNLGDGVATHCYATDVANRLTGWYSGSSSCDSSTIGSLTGSTASSGSSAVSSVVADVSSVVSSEVSEATSAASVTTSAYSIPTVSTEPLYTNEPGGVFAQVAASSSSSSSTAAPTYVTSAASVPTEAASSTAAAAQTTFTTKVTTTITTSKAIATATATSIPDASLPVTVTTASAVPTSSSITYPSASSSSSKNTTYTPGTSCSTTGQWNCINGNSFQQCASGVWSEVGNLAAGTSCTVGEGNNIDIWATKSAHKRHANSMKMKHGHLHALKRDVSTS